MKFHARLAQDPTAIWNQTLKLGQRTIKAWVWNLGENKFKYEICDVTCDMRKTLVTSVVNSLPSAKREVFVFFKAVETQSAKG